MNCPACKKQMVILEYKSVELDYCLSCEGSWLDKGELGLILHGELDVPRDWVIEKTTESKRRCPRCHAKMLAGFLPGTQVEVDVCANHHGIWLDRGELTAIAEARAPDGEVSAIGKFCADVFKQVNRNGSSENGGNP